MAMASPRTEQVSQLLAIRIRSFGGALGVLAPGATLHKKDLSLVAFKTRSRLQYLRFLLATIIGRQTFSQAIELLDADAVECRPANGSKIEGVCGSRRRGAGRSAGPDRTCARDADAPRSAGCPAYLSERFAVRSPSCNHRCDVCFFGVFSMKESALIICHCHRGISCLRRRTKTRMAACSRSHHTAALAQGRTRRARQPST